MRAQGLLLLVDVQTGGCSDFGMRVHELGHLRSHHGAELGVTVENQDELSGGRPERLVVRRAEVAIGRVPDQPDLWEAPRDGIRAAVGRGIVHDGDIDRDGSARSEDGLDASECRVSRVEAHDGDRQGSGRGSGHCWECD